MPNYFIRSFALPLLAALPLHVLAAPVAITSQMSGEMTIYGGSAIVLLNLDMADALSYDKLPFELTVQSRFNPGDSPNIQGNRFRYNDAHTSVSFKLGNSMYERETVGTTYLWSDSEGYRQKVEIFPWLSFYVSFAAPQGSASGDFFGLRQVSLTGDNVGTASITYAPNAPDSHVWENITQNGTSATLSITSAVPEPSHWAMLAAGLLVVSAGARRAARKRGAV